MDAAHYSQNAPLIVPRTEFQHVRSVSTKGSRNVLKFHWNKRQISIAPKPLSMLCHRNIKSSAHKSYNIVGN